MVSVQTLPGRLALGFFLLLLICRSANAGFECAIFKAKIWTPDGKAGVYFFTFVTSATEREHPVYTWNGDRILSVMKKEGPSRVTVHRKLQTVAFPLGLTFVTAREDVEVLKGEQIARIEKLHGYDTRCMGGHGVIKRLPQNAIDLLQSEPLAQVEWSMDEYSREVCLSYRTEIAERELLSLCKRTRAEAEIKLRALPDTVAAYEARIAERFDRLIEQGVVAIEIHEIP